MVVLITLKEYILYLNKIFNILINIEIYIKSIKVFISYLFIKLLRKYIDSIRLITSKEKIYIISTLNFPNTLYKLKIYLGLTC